MFSRAYSATVLGIEAVVIQVEADMSEGLPMFQMVGYLSSEVKEAKERVRIAMKNSGFLLLPKKITVNLSPADIRKEGTAFDLPIAIAILASFGMIPDDNLNQTLFIGELSLDGTVQCVSGVLPIVYTAKQQGFHRCIVPMENAKEAAAQDGIEVIGVKNLKEAVSYLNNRTYLEPTYVNTNQLFQDYVPKENIDFSDVVGQELVKRALEIAVSGMHNILLIGPPGSGKTMLAKRVPTIMPKLTFDESIEITKVYSVSGLLNEDQSLILERPFRSPHHTVTSTALIGGGRIPKPGEISLATGGVLFLDELAEYHRGTLELLRQPIEERNVTIARLNGTYHYPANFMLVGAMNPCCCGSYPDMNRCTCTPTQVKRYLQKISKPLLERIDIVIETQPVDYSSLNGKKSNESSKDILERVMEARERQLHRYENEPIFFNSQLSPRTMRQYCSLGTKERTLMENVFERLNLSARMYHRIIKVARTIADLAGSEEIKTVHLSEAICYRSLDQKYWGKEQ